MKYIPMLYSTPMVQALIQKRKTKTRRTKDLEEVNKRVNDWVTPIQMPCSSDNKWVFTAEHGEAQQLRIKCPYGNVGDVIWVRETFSKFGKGFIYKADALPEFEDLNIRWKPNIHIPKIASRIFLEIVSIKLERLQDITEEDAVAEGVFKYSNGVYKFYTEKQLKRVRPGVSNARDSFYSLWTSLEDQKKPLVHWKNNPWVWVIEFKQIDKPLNFLN